MDLRLPPQEKPIRNATMIAYAILTLLLFMVFVKMIMPFLFMNIGGENCERAIDEKEHRIYYDSHKTTPEFVLENPEYYSLIQQGYTLRNCRI